jgi:ubiquitin carboxyl-terminal hydrolase 25/28
LFFNLEYCEAAAVTPTVELAKLALITSRDEEEDEGGTDSSNDTDATLVEDGPSRSSILGPLQTSQSPSSSSSVLGKRPRDLDRQRLEMEVDSPLSQSPKENDGFVLVPSMSPPQTSDQIQQSAGASSSKAQLTDEDGDVQMEIAPTAKAAPTLKKHAEPSDSTMMFGMLYPVYMMQMFDTCHREAT